MGDGDNERHRDDGGDAPSLPDNVRIAMHGGALWAPTRGAPTIMADRCGAMGRCRGNAGMAGHSGAWRGMAGHGGHPPEVPRRSSHGHCRSLPGNEDNDVHAWWGAVGAVGIAGNVSIAMSLLLTLAYNTKLWYTNKSNQRMVTASLASVILGF